MLFLPRRLAVARARLALATLLIAIGGCAAVASSAPTTAHAAADASSAKAKPKPRHTARKRTKHKAPKRHVTKAIWGPLTLPDGSSAFPTYRALGAKVLEMDLTWADAAPTQPADPRNPADAAYRWPAALDAAVAAAKQYRMQLCLLVQRTPAWANGGQGPQWAPNRDSDYGNFLAAASRRYPTVKLWMIWGEPNRYGGEDFLPMPANSPVGPRRYATLLAAAYHSLKGISRSNTVIGGDTWSFGTVEPADFLRWMRLPNGAPPPLDLYGHNPFGRRFPNLSESPYFHGGRDINDVDTLEAQLRSTYHRQVGLWLSEYTISSDHNNGAFDFHVSRAAQAQWLGAAYRLANSVPYVAGLGWFNLLDDAPGTNLDLTQGLLTFDAHPKPAYYAYQHAP